MNVNRISILAAFLMLCTAGAAMAQPQVLVDNETVPLGTPSVSITVAYNGNPEGTAAQFQVVYNATDLTADISATCPNPLQWGCTENTPGTIQFASGFFGAGGLPNFSGEVVFDLTSASTTTYPLNVVGELYTETSGQVAPSGTQNGSITIEGPDYSSNPVPGPLPLGSVQQGGTNPTATVDISNVGPGGTELDVSCVEFPNTAAFSITNGTVNNLTPAGSPHTVTVTCDANQAPATYNGTMRCTHNGDGTTTASPADYALSCTVTPGPAPAIDLSPTTLNFGTVPKNDPDPSLNFTIGNSGDSGTTLSGSCSLTNNPNSAYSITAGGGAYSVLQGDPAHTVTVECDTSVAGNHGGGTVSCTHNGSNVASPVNVTLNCTIPPEPAITATPNPNPLDLGPVPQNNADPLGTLTIDNTGDPNSTLSGSCSLTDGSGPISIQSGGGAYSVPEAGPNRVVTVACDSSDTPDTYNDTLSCTHNEVDGTASPVTFPIECTIGQPDPAVFGSSPPSGSTLNFNSGGSVIVGDPDPTLPLEIRNDADTGDADMDVTCELNQVSGTAISVDPAVTNLILEPGASQVVTFTCDTETVSPPGTPYEAQYGCNWSSVPVPELPVGAPPPAYQETYTVICEVLDAESDVEPHTPSGTTVVELVEPGGSAQFQFTFEETLGEGADGSLDCSLDDGAAGFTIQSPAFPATVPSGGTVTVIVQGTDPGGVESTQDTLRCTYTDTTDPQGVEVFYNLVLLIGGNASFAVDKVFTDGNPGEVTVAISCNTGLPLDQSKVISEGDGVTFIVGDFDNGEMDCSITELPVPGYSASYDAGGSDSAFEDSDPDNPGCHFFDIAGGDENSCVVTNTPDPVDVVITKDWLFEGSNSPDGVSTYYELTLFCDSEIIGGYNLYEVPAEGGQGLNGSFCGFITTLQEGGQTFAHNWCKGFSGNGPAVFGAEVIPEYPSSHCYVVENVYDDAVEVDNGCTSLTFAAGAGSVACTITNTVFFEGIPTLSQYGLAVLALLMLGVGLVGFRRFA